MSNRLARFLVVLVVPFFFTIPGVFAYTNYISPPSQEGSVGDPFVMKYNGVYYLYCSSGAAQFRVWSSFDLVTWTYSGICASDPIIADGYAPEVKYWNGTFYMYTSPHGGGHYVLTSTSPTGPFTIATGNLGHSIDGDVFVDDNGSWYFSSASGGGINIAPMSSPLMVGNDVLHPETRISGQWTEGPTIFKRNGTYYLTATGNHVLSSGYRVSVSSNTGGPLQAFNPSSLNPVLINTEGTVVGTGHSSELVGPDLDTYYMVYHNYDRPGNFREYNLDAVGFNDDKMVVLGPTSWTMPDPARPNFEDRFQRTNLGSGYSNLNGGTWSVVGNFLKQSAMGSTQFAIEYENVFTTASDYTAEYNVQEISRGSSAPKSGAVYGYVDSQNYGVAVIRGNTKQLETEVLVNGVWSTTVLTALPSDFDSTKLHVIRVEKYGSTYKYFVDGLWNETKTNAGLGAGKVGYLSCDNVAQFGYIATSNKINGSGVFDLYKPVPGVIQAVHYNWGGEGVGYHDTTIGNAGGAYTRNDNVDIRTNPEGGTSVGWNSTGEWYKYNVSVKAAGTYNLGLRYATIYSTSQVRIWCDSTDVTGVITLPATGGWDNWRTYDIRGLSLPAGFHTIKLETITGEFDFYTLKFYQADNGAISFLDTFSGSFSTSWTFRDGNWSDLNNAGAYVNNIGKMFMGNIGWSDYTVEANVAGLGGLNSGIIVRANNPSTGGDGTDVVAGTDFYQGYFAFLSASGVSLGKVNYGWSTLASTAGTYNLAQFYHLKVICSRNNIKVYVDGVLKIDYTDDNTPFINGKVGVRAYFADTIFDDFQVTR